MDRLNHIQIELLRRHRVGATDERIVQGIHLTINGIAGKLARLKQGASAGWLYAVVTKPTANFTRLDPGRPEIAILVDAMLRAREVVAARPRPAAAHQTTITPWARARLQSPASMASARRAAASTFTNASAELPSSVAATCARTHSSAAVSSARVSRSVGRAPMCSLTSARRISRKSRDARHQKTPCPIRVRFPRGFPEFGLGQSCMRETSMLQWEATLPTANVAIF